jgi:endonuclease-3
MGTAKATRAADKSTVCRRLVQALQKLYGKTVPQIQLPVLETMLFAVCLEDNRWEQAETGLKRLIGSFFDLNEIRVSSVTELERALDGLSHADWKGMPDDSGAGDQGLEEDSGVESVCAGFRAP